MTPPTSTSSPRFSKPFYDFACSWYRTSPVGLVGAGDGPLHWLAMTMTQPHSWLELKGIHKRFGATHALKGVDLSLVPGEVLALIGENGAGKSTLVKTLTGVYAPDAGQILVQGVPTVFARAQDAQQTGIAAVHQETVMFEELSVAENIYIGRQPVLGHRYAHMIDWQRMLQDAQTVLDKVGAGFSASTLVKHLSLAQRHLVEIARALSQEARVVILDEPTAALSQQEIRDFYELVRRLKSQDVAVLFITHKFDEIFSVCDRYVVLRDGATVGTGMIKDTDKDSLIRLMAGREIHQIYPAIAANTGPVVLQVQHLNHPSEFSQINFELRRGEILGFYGLVGAGRSEIMLALMGLNNAASGIIKINGQQVTIRKPADAIGHGLAYVPEERQLQGGILDFAVMHNLSIADLSGALGQRASLSIGPWLSARKENDLSDTLIEQLQIKTANVHTALGTLSGGNQQKVVIGKWLGIQPNIIILDEPTKGIDVGAKQAVYRLIADMVAQGLAVILVSSELPEVMHLAHRIVVMRRGRMAAVFDRDQVDAQEVVAVASGLRTADKEVHA